jgi:RHS repeat-associated protein
MGTITTWSCAAPGNGFTLTKQYILGPSGEQMTEVDYSGGSATWAHTNAYAGDVVATYLNDGQGPHYRLADWLGTTRVQVNSAGVAELTCASLPFGDPQVPCTSPSATEQFFTGQERDQETGNDYFRARYYASSMGRFISPDPSGLTYADPTNPQSLNLYAYVGNNPLAYIDPSGLHWACASATIVDQNGNPTPGSGSSGTQNCQWVNDPVGINDADNLGLSLFMPQIGNMSSSNSSNTNVAAANPAPNNGVPVHGPWTYGHFCGAGGTGTPINGTDAACQQHDACYAQAGFSPGSNYQASNPQLQACNQQLCNSVRAQRTSLLSHGAGPIRTSRGTSGTSNLSPGEYQEFQADNDINLFFTWLVAPGNSCHLP